MDLVEADKLVPDALVEARQKADVPSVLLRGYIGEVGETIKLLPRRDQDSWTEIEAADILARYRAVGVATLVVRRVSKVPFARAGSLSDVVPVKVCNDQWTGEETCWRGILYAKVIRTCQAPYHPLRHWPNQDILWETWDEVVWVPVGSCEEDSDLTSLTNGLSDLANHGCGSRRYPDAPSRPV